MTGKDYLVSVLKDPFVEASSVQTRTALCAYALRINQEINGYSLDELESLIKQCGYGDDFTEACSAFISNAKEAYQYITRIPLLDD